MPGTIVGGGIAEKGADPEAGMPPKGEDQRWLDAKRILGDAVKLIGTRCCDFVAEPVEADHVHTRRAQQNLGVVPRIFPAEISSIVHSIGLGSGCEPRTESMLASVRELAKAVHREGPATTQEQSDIGSVG